ncbi:MAG: RagB/SusD family nutrient uptake outer membrane protein [Bacteroidales bacterium]
MKLKNLYLFAILSLFSPACNYLDVIPDNVSTIEHAFADEQTAQRYLFTCYAGLPQEYNTNIDPAMTGSNEFWQGTPYSWIDAPFKTPFRIKDGYQNSNAPYVDNYSGGNGGTPLFQTIRKCYVFQKNVENVLGLNPTLKERWIAETKVIIAYSYLCLLRQYGPVPIIDREYPIDADPAEIRKARNTMDECVAFATGLLDEASPKLPLFISNRAEELGRFTEPIARSIKAKILLLAASPLFNGNKYLADWTNNDGTNLLSPYSDDKWEKARVAAKEAIEACNTAGIKLYRYESSTMSKARLEDLTIRGGITNRDWIDELVWGAVPSGSTNNTHQIQLGAIINFNGVALNTSGGLLFPSYDVTLNTANKFYTSNGLPIEEDQEWAGKSITDLRMPTPEEAQYVDGSSINAEFNLSREPRYYSSIAFNRAKWYGNGQQGENFHIIRFYMGESANTTGSLSEWGTKTGMRAKKLVNPETTLTGTPSSAVFTSIRYPFPRIRLADLYLMYAEAANEAGNPEGDAIQYIDLVRERAGLKGVTESWTKSLNPTKPYSKEGLREIIRQERDIELAFEGHYFWDSRRWMTLHSQESKVLAGWNSNASTPEEFYVEDIKKVLTFNYKDYLWPINVNTMIKNPQLVQAKGW